MGLSLTVVDGFVDGLGYGLFVGLAMFQVWWVSGLMGFGIGGYGFR